MDSPFYINQIFSRTPQFTATFAHGHMKKPSKVVYFRKNVEIFNTGLTAQTAQTAKFRTIKSLLMQDWIFRLGSAQLIYWVAFLFPS